MQDFDWVIFDSTGTLMTPHPEPAVVYHAVAQQLGSAADVSKVRTDLKAAMKRHFFGETAAEPTNEDHEYRRWNRIVTDTLQDLDRDRLDRAFEQLWSHFALPDSWQLYSDVERTVARLRDRGYRTAIASNFDARLIPILSGLGVEPLFDQVLVNSDLGYSKPSTRFYELAAERLNQVDPSRLLMIGDTYAGDVEAARNAGWDARHLVRDDDEALWRLTADL